MRSLFPKGRFAEIYMSCNIDECRKRDPNGLYKKALSGLIKDFTGLSSPYEAPETPELIIDTESYPVQECVDMIEEFLISNSLIPISQGFWSCQSTRRVLQISTHLMKLLLFYKESTGKLCQSMKGLEN